MSATIMTLRDEAGNSVAPRTSANAVMTEGGISVETALQQIGQGGGIAELPDDLVYMKEEEGDVSIAIKNVVYRYAPHNLLDNSDFRNPVNQRGVGNGTVNAWNYFIDRWQAADNALNVSFNGNGLYLNASSNAWLTQQVQLSAADAGKKYTLAFGLADGTVITASGTYPGGSNWVVFINKITDECEIRAGQIENYKTRYEILPKTAITVSWAALYEGEYTAETLPPYIPKGYGAELLECQRYYLPVLNGWLAGHRIYGDGSSVKISAPVQMRAHPQVVVGSNPAIYTTAGWETVTYTSVRDEIGGMYGVYMTETGVTALPNTGQTFLARGIVALSADL